MPVPSPDLTARVERVLARRPVAWERVLTGYSDAERWIARLADHRPVYLKLGVTEHSADAIRREAANLSHLAGAFLPEVIAYDDDDPPLLLLEDLSGAEWPPPWTDEKIDRVLGVLEEIAVTPPPPHAESIGRHRETLSGWRRIAEDARPFLALGLASVAWLERALPHLLEAEAAAVLDGTALQHFDVRSDNLCFAGPRTVVVDWNGAGSGNPAVDKVAWAPSLASEGGPPPERIAPGEPELVSIVAGYFAASAGLPPPDFPRAERIRQVQLTQLREALPWCARELELPPPDGPIA